MKNRLKSLFILTFIILVSFSLVSGCGSSDKKSGSVEKKQAEKGDYENNSTNGYSTADKTTTKNIDSQLKNTNNRKIVKNAKLDVETKKYVESIKQLESLVSQFNGYIENSNVNGGGSNESDQTRSASYSVRIPAEQLDSFISSVGTIGKITQKSISGEDITQEYFDKESRLKALKIEQASLEDFLKKAANVKDSMEIYKELTNVNTEIEQLTGEVQKLDQLVNLSKVEILLNEVPIEKVYDDGSFTSEVKNIFVDSSRALVTICGGIIKALVATIPFALVFGVVGYIGYLIYKKIKIRKNKI